MQQEGGTPTKSRYVTKNVMCMMLHLWYHTQLVLHIPRGLCRISSSIFKDFSLYIFYSLCWRKKPSISDKSSYCYLPTHVLQADYSLYRVYKYDLPWTLPKSSTDTRANCGTFTTVFPNRARPNLKKNRVSLLRHKFQTGFLKRIEVQLQHCLRTPLHFHFFKPL